MKITGLKVHVLTIPLADPFAFSQAGVRQRSATWVEVQTDEGRVGWGEAFAQGLEPLNATAAKRARSSLPSARWIPRCGTSPASSMACRITNCWETLLAALPVPRHSLFATQPVLEYDR